MRGVRHRGSGTSTQTRTSRLNNIDILRPLLGQKDGIRDTELSTESALTQKPEEARIRDDRPSGENAYLCGPSLLGHQELPRPHLHIQMGYRMDHKLSNVLKAPVVPHSWLWFWLSLALVRHYAFLDTCHMMRVWGRGDEGGDIAPTRSTDSGEGIMVGD
ncbi:hypothetical protein NDU88_001102 [Pleurodeles waltl]|uniref:Uncharacterized protein n=1 Tax=Pleurodeles waltl TaxID=8319 RepID=A0AAV7UT40_PLEWA|nr:hypothetical protein NDU88_001102 [Pleurodeles waltl]